MPRGVPASGKRQPRSFGAAAAPAETALAGGAEDDTVDVYDTSVEQETTDPADELEVTAVGNLLSQDRPRPVPDEELTPEQRRIKDLEDQLAKLSGRKDVEPEIEPVMTPGDEGNVLIHFLEDGLSALGKVWYRGEELEFEVGSQSHKDTFDRRGRSWLDLRHDEFAQVERYGKVMFRSGPWPGKTYLDGSFETLRGEREGSRVSPPTEAELAAAEKQRRRRAAPRLPSQV